jgi:hypothetical protein
MLTRNKIVLKGKEEDCVPKRGPDIDVQKGKVKKQKEGILLPVKSKKESIPLPGVEPGSRRRLTLFLGTDESDGC